MDALQHMKVGHQKVMLDWMFFSRVFQEPGVPLPVSVVYDLSTGALMAMQSTKDSSMETVAALAQTLETCRAACGWWASDEIAGEGVFERQSASDSAEACFRLTVIEARDQSKRASRFSAGFLWRTSWLWRLGSVVVFS